MTGAAAPTVLAADVTGTDIAMIVAIVVLLLFAIATAVAETAIVRMSKAKAHALLEDDRSGAKALVKLTEAPERWINSLLLVVLVCQIVQATLTGVVSGKLFGGLGVAVATFVNVVLVFVLAEAAPKTWALQNTERAALVTARPVSALVDFAPLRWVSRALIGLTNVILPGKGIKEGPFISEEELLALAGEAAEADVIEAGEHKLIESIIEFGDTVVREVMVPRPDMVTVPHDFRVADVMEVVLLNGLSRIPVLGEGIDDVIGVVYAKDLMRAERDGRESEPVGPFARRARFVPETKRVAELLPEMQSEKFHMALVIDEYGGTAGLVTLEDLIEELVGEIVDEYDVEGPASQELPDGAVRLSAGLSIDDANDALDDGDLPEGEWDTVGGLVVSRLGRLANVGDAVEVPGYHLQVDGVKGRRVTLVRVTAVERPDEDGEDEQPRRDGRPEASESEPAS